MSWTLADIPDQHGRVAVVTGANGGLGLQTARELARRGARVVMASRDLGKANDAARTIKTDVPSAELEIRQLDLASLDSVRACADGVAADYAVLHLLINNAGVMGIPERTTPDGFEMQLAVNHLGAFVLTRRLLPRLVHAPGARIVSVTSFARLIGRAVDPSNPHLRGKYSPWRAYNRSKLANMHLAVELQRRLDAAGTGAGSLVAHPGLSHTDLQVRSVRETRGGLSQRLWHWLARNIGMSANQGAWPQLRAATDPAAAGGDLYAPMWGMVGPPVRRPLIGRSLNRAAARTLWEVSERETGEPFDVGEILGEADFR